MPSKYPYLEADFIVPMNYALAQITKSNTAGVRINNSIMAWCVYNA